MMATLQETPTQETIGFFDARCTECGAKIGWYGRLADRPPCRRCGKVEDVDVPEIERQLRDNEAFCMVQTIYHEHKYDISSSELSFIRYVYRKYRDGGKYDAIQRKNIARIGKRFGVTV